MSQLPTASQIKEFKHRLEQYYRENRDMLIRRFSSMGEAGEIRSSIHLVLAEIFERYVHGQPAPENLGGYAHTAIRRKLIDLMRKEVWKERDKASIEDLDSPAVSKSLDLSLTPEEDQAGWKELFRIIFDRLPPKWHEVAKMVMLGSSPAEIGERFEQDGYVLRRYARQLICRILWELTDAGDELARGLASDFCPRPQQTA